MDTECELNLKIGEEDNFASAMFEAQKINKFANLALPFNCGGKSIVKNVSVAYNAGQVAKVTVTGEHKMAGTTKA